MTLENLVNNMLKIEPPKKERRKMLPNQRRVVNHMAAIYDKQKLPDWNNIIKEILDVGIQSAGLSIALGKSKSWADCYVKNNTQKMEYAVGNALLKIHKEYVK